MPLIGLVALTALAIALLAPSAFAQRPLGIDVSYWQGDLSQTTWNNVAAAGRSFAFIRCVHYGVSGGDPDPYFASNMTRARNAGLLVGAYHFARPTVRSPQTEADYFVYYATQYWTQWTQYGPNFVSNGFLRPVLDLEEGGGTTPVGAANLSAWANAWLDAVEAQTGVEPMVYCNSNYAKNYLNSTLASRTLWIANYSCSIDPQTASPPAGIGIWSNWTFWQYCSSLAVGGISPVDTDVFNGTAAQLQNYVIGGGNAPPVISNVQATNVTNSAATIIWATDSASSSQVQYGLTSSYGSSSPLDSTAVTSHSVTISGLSANTLYHYRVISTNAYGTTNSTDYTFTTSGAPVISNVQATAVTSAGATITWTTNAPATSQVYYGLTAGYGNQTALDSNLVTNHSVVLTGLTPNTLYHYKALSGNAYGSAQSGDYTFTTTAYSGEVIVDNTDPGFAYLVPTTPSSWRTGTASSHYGSDYFWADGVSGTTEASATYKAQWTPNLPVAGTWDVYIWYASGGNRSTQTYWKVVNAGTTLNLRVNETINGNGWTLLASDVSFNAGTSGNVQMWNNIGSTTKITQGDAVRFVLKSAAVQPPTITQHPAAQSVCAGGTATFTVAATGDGSLTYQWQKSGSNLSDSGHYAGTTTTTLTVSNADAADAASYACLVTNSGGSTASNAASLTINAATAITQQPQSQTVDTGSGATFTVIATGSGVIAYQWQKDGTSLGDGGHYAGTTAGTLILSDADSANAGSYTCVVTAGCGSITSTAATLTVNPPSSVVAADFDGDGDVDLGDFAFLQMCFNGPNQAPAQPECGPADFDGDADVDLADFSVMQACFNGPNRPPACP